MNVTTPALDPRTAALLVMDYQQAILASLPGLAEQEALLSRVAITTSGVVLSTVTDAADRDYRLYVLSDGVADPDPQAHQTLMTSVFPRMAHIIDTAELRSLLHESRLHQGRGPAGRDRQ